MGVLRVDEGRGQGQARYFQIGGGKGEWVGRRQGGNKTGLNPVWQRERRTFTVVFVLDAEAAFHLLQDIHGGEGFGGWRYSARRIACTLVGKISNIGKPVSW